MSELQSNEGGPRYWEANHRLLISAAVFGLLFSVLFTKQSLGLNVALCAVMVYIFAVINEKQLIKKSFRQQRAIYLFSLPVVYLGLLFFISDTFMRFFGLPLMLLLLLVQYLVLSGTAIYSWDEGRFLLDLICGGINRVLLGMHCFIAGVISTLFKGRKKGGVVIGILLGAGLLIITIPVLAAADENMAHLIDRILTIRLLGDIFIYGFIFLIGASVVTGPAATASFDEISGKRQALRSQRRTPFEPVTIGVALTMLGVLYVVFASVQFPYFFAPRETLAQVLGLTSSAYAVRGFGELVFISCLNFALIGISLRFTKQKESGTHTYLKIIYVLLIAFNFVIMASSHIRMQLYVEYFGHSVLRFTSHSFMLLLCVLNAVMLARVFSDKVKTVRLFAAASLVYFCTVSAINPERFVARANIARYEMTGEIDTQYLLSLSAEAVIETVDFLQSHPEELDEQSRAQAGDKMRSFETQSQGWPSVNLAVISARQKLEQLLE